MNGATTTSQPDKACDLVIVGGGHSGLLLALAMEQHGLRPTVIDADPTEAVLSAPFDGRALALMQGSKRVFEALGLWPDFLALATPIRGVRVEDAESGGAIAYDAEEVDDGAFGYGMETRTLRARLLKLALAKSSIRYRPGRRLLAFSRDAESLELTLDNEHRLKTSLVIGADGRRSTVRRLAGIGIDRIHYDQTAITFAIRHADHHEGRVREFMSRSGPLALLPIGPDLSSVTWIDRPNVVSGLISASPDDLLDALKARTGHALAPIELLGRPAAFPLSAETARAYAASRVALVGDAAHGLHPIHAQGWNLGVRDVAALTEVLVQAKGEGRDLGSGEILQRYARWRQGDAQTILGLTDGLNRLFSTDFIPAKLARRTGLAVVDRLSPVKGWLMRRGMGVAGDLPKLARGEPL